jgi:hypothetical protein
LASPEIGYFIYYFLNGKEKGIFDILGSAGALGQEMFGLGGSGTLTVLAIRDSPFQMVEELAPAYSPMVDSEELGGVLTEAVPSLFCRVWAA